MHFRQICYIVPIETGKRMDRPSILMYGFNIRVGSTGVDLDRKFLKING